MKKRLVKVMVASVMISSLMNTTVFATNTTDAKKNVDSLENTQSAKQSEVNSLQAQLNNLVAAIAEAEDALVKTGEKKIQAKIDLKKAEKSEKKQYKSMMKRIKYMYEGGNAEIISAIANAKGLADILNKAEYISNISGQDKKMLEKYVETKQRIADIKVSLEEEEKTLVAKQKEYSEKRDEVNKLIEAKKGEVSNIAGQLTAAAQAYAQAKARDDQAGQIAQVKKEEQAAPVPVAASQPEESYVPAPIEVVEPEPSYGGSDTVSRAQSWVGKAEYVWGACSPGQFDCSGFVAYCLTGIYARLGTTYTFLGWPQVTNPQPGDVCVNSEHCGIYVGDGQMIHAADEGIGVIYGPVQTGMIYVRY